MLKIGELSPSGVAALKIYYDSKAETNPYKVVMEWMELGPYGLRKKTRTVVKYADLLSCVMVLTHYAEAHNEERR